MKEHPKAKSDMFFEEVGR